MSQELSNCHEVLGVSEGASAQELKVAYRDLAKVWHPDRFAHDPRLQQKAQEKLKEINEAYEQLTSGKTRFEKRASGKAQTHTPHTPQHPPQYTPQYSSQHTPQPRAAWRVAVLPVVVFMVVLSVSGALLIAGRAPSPQHPAPEAESGNVEQTFVESASDAVREQQRASRKPVPKQPSTEAIKESKVEPAAAPKMLTPLPTVTLTIDPSTGLIATAHCPLKSRITYADGTEPRQHCSSHQTDRSATADVPQKESRLKSLTGRLASPSKWFRGKEKSVSAPRETPASHNTVKQN